MKIYDADLDLEQIDYKEMHYEMLSASHERMLHNQDGYFAEKAGSPACVALGHKEPEGGWYERYDDEEHLIGWDNEPLCVATRFGVACTVCEGECDAMNSDLYMPAADFWKMVRA